VYGRDRGTVTRLDNGRVEIDPDGSGPARPFILDPHSNEASFLSRALRVNTVLRWECRGGSTLYLVWQQTRDQSSALAGTAPCYSTASSRYQPGMCCAYARLAYWQGLFRSQRKGVAGSGYPVSMMTNHRSLSRRQIVTYLPWPSSFPASPILRLTIQYVPVVDPIAPP
jgi:hypothetical protein